MPYPANPFLERMSELTVSDQEFVNLFSPKILERLPEETFAGGIHVFRSPPGGGKTTLLRAFTPSAVRAFWNARHAKDMAESVAYLKERGVLHESEGPQLLGVLLSCASGYADLPPGASIEQEGLFRALLDCRIVLRTLRSLALLLGRGSADRLDNVRLEYDDNVKDLKSIPLAESAAELVQWAEQHERSVYAQLDSIAAASKNDMPSHVRFEAVLWLQGVRFVTDGRPIAPRRVLMIDDLHRLRRKQRALLIEELIELRPTMSVWLAERNIVLGDELLSQGARAGRDVKSYSLEEFWNTSRGQFATHAQNILQRRIYRQNDIPPGPFTQYLRTHFQANDLQEEIRRGIEKFQQYAQRHESNPHYAEWLARAKTLAADVSIESLLELYTTRILIARNEAKRQLALDLAPLPAEELEERDNSQIRGAAEIFMHDELKIPHYYGIERLCTMATNNVEELLALAAALYDGLQAKMVLRKPEPLLSPAEQEKLLVEAAKLKRGFIPKSHTEGTRAQRLLDAIGAYCRSRTFLPNAPYAPGVTGVRLSQAELAKLRSDKGALKAIPILRKVLSECVAENLLVAKASAASTNRDSGTVFYLNRTLCAHYGLPLSMGGWQDVEVIDLIEWMENATSDRHRRMEVE